MKKVILLVFFIISTNAFSATYQKTFFWNEGSDWYPIQWIAHDGGTPATWAASTAYSTGATVVGSSPVYGMYYECTRAGTSGATEPTWPTTNGTPIDDPDASGAQWTVRTTDIVPWVMHITYAVGDKVSATSNPAYGWYYECVRGGLSGSLEPTWVNTEGVFIVGTLPDKPVIVRIFADDTEIGQIYDNADPATQTEYAPTMTLPSSRVYIIASAERAIGGKWLPTTPYIIGDLVVATAIFGHGYVYYECTRAGTSGATEPTWSNVNGTTIDDPDASGAQWTVRNMTVNPWQPSTAYNNRDLITPNTQKLPGNTVYECTRAGTSGTVEPDWEQGGKIPWFAFFRKWWQKFGSSIAIEDPDNNGCQWIRTQRGGMSEPSASIRLLLKDADDATENIGRSRN